MAFYDRNNERKRFPRDCRRLEEEVAGSLRRLGSRSVSPESLYEQEKRIRREIANSNERRRMQSINAGFQSLRALLPHRTGGELSKAAILERTADYVYKLKQEKNRLLEQNHQLSNIMLNSPYSSNNDSDCSCSNSPIPKRKKREPADFVDEGSSASRSEHGGSEVADSIKELRRTLERERALRLLLEEKITNLESRLSQLDNDPDVTDQMVHLQDHTKAENNFESSRSIRNSVRGSLQCQIPSQDVESNEVPPSESGSDPSIAEMPKNLSKKNNATLFSSVDELSVSDAAIQQDTCKVGSRSRQNLEIIVEAIKHVEGDIFQGDDPKPVESKLPPIDKEEKDLSGKRVIGNEPFIPSRPGVIIFNAP